MSYPPPIPPPYHGMPGPGAMPDYPPQGYPPSYGGSMKGYPEPGYSVGYMPVPPAQGGDIGDPESQPNDTSGFATFAFNDKTIRRKFISKVYIILSVQLAVTFAFVSVFLLVPAVTRWVQRNQWFYWMSYALFLVTHIALACCAKVRRRFPGNFIALGIFTLAFSYMAGTITSFYEVNSVLICLAITVGVTFTVSVAAACCPCDITKCQAAIAFLSVLFLIFGLVCTLVYFIAGYNSTLQAVYGGVAAVVFTIYLAYDTKMILGGGRYEMSPEEYIFGALQLYLDVVNIFLAMLSLFGRRN